MWAVLMASLKIIGSGLLTAIPLLVCASCVPHVVLVKNHFSVQDMGCYLSATETHWVRSANSQPPPGPCASCVPHVVIGNIHLVFRTWVVI